MCTHVGERCYFCWLAKICYLQRICKTRMLWRRYWRDDTRAKMKPGFASSAARREWFPAAQRIWWIIYTMTSRPFWQPLDRWSNPSRNSDKSNPTASRLGSTKQKNISLKSRTKPLNVTTYHSYYSYAIGHLKEIVKSNEFRQLVWFTIFHESKIWGLMLIIMLVC